MSETVRRFEDLEVWQIARELANMIYSLARAKPMASDFGFIDQIRRAAVSIMNNIAEGYERGSNRDFLKFLYIARASAGEVRSMLYVAVDQKYINTEEFKRSKALCVRSSQMCWGLIRHLQAKRNWRTGGVVAVFDGDYSSLTYAYPDHEVGQAMAWALVESAFNNPIVMHGMPRLLSDAGLHLQETLADVVAEIGTGSYFVSMAETYAPMVKSADLMPAETVDAWLAHQLRAVDQGLFFASCNYYAYLARRPVSAG